MDRGCTHSRGRCLSTLWAAYLSAPVVALGHCALYVSHRQAVLLLAQLSAFGPSGFRRNPEAGDAAAAAAAAAAGTGRDHTVLVAMGSVRRGAAVHERVAMLRYSGTGDMLAVQGAGKSLELFRWGPVWRARVDGAADVCASCGVWPPPRMYVTAGACNVHDGHTYIMEYLPAWLLPFRVRDEDEAARKLKRRKKRRKEKAAKKGTKQGDKDKGGEQQPGSEDEDEEAGADGEDDSIKVC